MTVAHPLTLTDTRIEPQPPHNMAGHTTRIASKIQIPKIFRKTNKKRRNFSTIFLLSWLRVASNALFKSLELTSEAAPSYTHEINNPGATPT